MDSLATHTTNKKIQHREGKKMGRVNQKKEFTSFTSNQQTPKIKKKRKALLLWCWYFLKESSLTLFDYLFACPTPPIFRRATFYNPLTKPKRGRDGELQVNKRKKQKGEMKAVL